MIIDLGGVRVLFRPYNQSEKLILTRHYQAFLTDGRPDVSVVIRRESQPLIAPENPVFTTDHWAVVGNGDQITFYLEFPRNPRERDLYLLKKTGDKEYTISFFSEKPFFRILPHFLDGWLITYFLSLKHGLMFHSSGLNFSGQGFLFLGESGSGKTTMANLWRQFGVQKEQFLGEERVAVRKAGGVPVLHAVPWYGWANRKRPVEIPLGALFFIRHNPENHFRSLGPAEAMKVLLPKTFLPFWDPSAMEYSMDLAHELCTSIPCYDFGFTPDIRAVEAVCELIGS